MRHFLATVVLVLAGCAAQGLPLDDSTGGNGGGGGGSGHGNAADMARPLGGTGAKCTTACDCEPGLACRQGMCGMSQIGAIYCCDSNQCPAGSFCQSSMGGFAQCGSSGGGTGGAGGGGAGGFGGGPGGGGPADLGIGMFCHQIPCGTNGNVCKMIGCGACTAAGTCGTN